MKDTTIADLFRINLVTVLAFVIMISAIHAQDADAKIISAPEYKLSSEAESARIDGNVKVLATIKKDGSVASVEVVAGPAWPCGTEPKKELEEVRKAIKENVLATKFEPVLKDGKPKEVDAILNFAIGKEYRRKQREREEKDAIASGKSAPSTIKGGVLNGRAISLPKPAYPALAKEKRARGTVTIEILVDETGKVIQAGAVNGWYVFHNESRLAACAARFAPTLLEGNPVKVSGKITYNFAAR